MWDTIHRVIPEHSRAQLGYALTQGGNINFAVSECLAQRANSWHCVKVADVCAKVASFRLCPLFPSVEKELDTVLVCGNIIRLV